MTVICRNENQSQDCRLEANVISIKQTKVWKFISSDVILSKVILLVKISLNKFKWWAYKLMSWENVRQKLNFSLQILPPVEGVIIYQWCDLLLPVIVLAFNSHAMKPSTILNEIPKTSFKSIVTMVQSAISSLWYKCWICSWLFFGDPKFPQELALIQIYWRFMSSHQKLLKTYFKYVMYGYVKLLLPY